MMETNDEKQPRAWERQPTETIHAYRAFCIYRDLDETRRSLEAAWKSHSGKSTPPPGKWTLWCSKHRWVLRAQAYDLYRESERRNLAEQAANEEYKTALRDLSLRQRAAGEAIIESSLALLAKVGKRIQELDIKEIEPSRIGEYLRACAAGITCGSQAQQEALAVEELMAAVTNGVED